jgi:hypothetical protein
MTARIPLSLSAAELAPCVLISATVVVPDCISEAMFFRAAAA